MRLRKMKNGSGWKYQKGEFSTDITLALNYLAIAEIYEPKNLPRDPVHTALRHSDVVRTPCALFQMPQPG